VYEGMDWTIKVTWDKPVMKNTARSKAKVSDFFMGVVFGDEQKSENNLT
jgi:hypothetical protein